MTSRVQTVWSSCLERISDLVPKYSYNTWIRPLRAVSLDEKNGKVLNLEVPNTFHQKWIEENYLDIVGTSIKEVLGPQAALQLSLPLASDTSSNYTPTDYITNSADHRPRKTQHTTPQHAIASNFVHKQAQPHARINQHTNPPASMHRPQDILLFESSKKKPMPPQKLPAQAAQFLPNKLNEHHTFEELVEGEGNRLASGAAKAIARSPGSTRFNPMFIYGSVGLGKTHLAQAICQYAVHHETARNPMYVTIDDFTNQFIASIRANRCHEFTGFFRQVDLLIVDDIQFLSGKERTQEEFFHLFNAIYQSGGQIVLCADRAPGEIAGIHNRLISRFHWGLTTDIQVPDLPTRKEILLRKAARYKIDLSGEITEKIASVVQRNVRELESVLTKLLAYSSLHKVPVTLHLTDQILQHYGSQPHTQITLDEIITVVAETFGTRTEYIVSKSRKREIVLARHAAMYLAKEFTMQSLKSIGLHFAGRDHSTVIHAVKAVEARIETEASFAGKLEHARNLVQERADGLRNNVMPSQDTANN